MDCVKAKTDLNTMKGVLIADRRPVCRIVDLSDLKEIVCKHVHASFALQIEYNQFKSIVSFNLKPNWCNIF